LTPPAEKAALAIEATLVSDALTASSLPPIDVTLVEMPDTLSFTEVIAALTLVMAALFTAPALNAADAMEATEVTIALTVAIAALSSVEVTDPEPAATVEACHFPSAEL
jgi:hypothetical protein